MSEAVVVHVTRRLDDDDPRRPRQTIESLRSIPKPKRGDGVHVSYWTGRQIKLPGFSGGWVWGSLAEARRFSSIINAGTATLQIGSHAFAVDETVAVEYERLRHLQRARAKARQAGRR